MTRLKLVKDRGSTLESLSFRYFISESNGNSKIPELIHGPEKNLKKIGSATSLISVNENKKLFSVILREIK